MAPLAQGDQAALAGLYDETNALVWRDGPTDGVAMKPIFSDAARKVYTSPVRTGPRARLPPHRHLTSVGERFHTTGPRNGRSQLMAQPVVVVPHPRLSQSQRDM